jgi:hypothetical protein
MPRTYEVSFVNVAVSAAQDLIAIIGGAGKMLRIKRVKWGCSNTTLATGQNLSTQCRIMPATYTTGSAGSAPTPRPVDPGDTAATFTARANDTVKATTSGTPEIVDEDGSHLFAGYNFSFPNPPLVGPTAGFVFELLSTVSGTVNLSGVVEVEEMG